MTKDEALRRIAGFTLSQFMGPHDMALECVNVARDAFAQPEQEPMASGEPLPCPFCGHTGLDFSDGSTYRWGHASCGGCGAKCGEVRREYPDKGEWHSEAIAEWNRRYTRPQAREPLSDEVIDYLWRVATTKPGLTLPMVRGFARAIEAAHGIKE